MALALVLSACLAAQPADLVLRNGKVWTGDELTPAIQKAVADYAKAHPSAPWITKEAAKGLVSRP